MHSINSIHTTVKKSPQPACNDKHFKTQYAIANTLCLIQRLTCALHFEIVVVYATPNIQRETLRSPEEVHEKDLFCVNTHSLAAASSDLNTHEIVYLFLPFNVMCCRCAVCVCASCVNTLQKGTVWLKMT